MTQAKFERPKNPKKRSDLFSQYGRTAWRWLKHAGMSVGLFIAYWTLAAWQRRVFERKIARGETIWIEDLPKPPGAETQTFEGLEPIPADLSPSDDLPSRKAKDMSLDAYPTPDYPFAYRNPPLSGMVIAGHGETEKRRPYHQFFNFNLAWGGLSQILYTVTRWSTIRHMVALFWEDRRRIGPVVRERQPVSDPTTMSDHIKAVAMERGAALVGITEPHDEWFFEDFEPSYRYAIAVAVPMDREEMRYAPTGRSLVEVFRIYREVGRVAIDTAAYIRSLGYEAMACTNITPDTTEVLHVPIAVAAGLGQLGKHNSMITKDYGSNVRLATVLTDMPLEIDQPVDIGVDDFCMSCQICTTNCPPQAIFETKQMVRGEERWFVNFDQCAPYFVANGSCGICIEVCPWSEPGRGEVIMEKMLSRRGQVTV